MKKNKEKIKTTKRKIFFFCRKKLRKIKKTRKKEKRDGILEEEKVWNAKKES